jgi:hypothetical protein
LEEDKEPAKSEPIATSEGNKTKDEDTKDWLDDADV